MIKPNNISDTGFLNHAIYIIESEQKLLIEAIGNNKKSILINILQPSATDELIAFLEKILSAAKLTMREDVLIISTKKVQQYNFANLAQQQNIQKAIFFGQDTKTVGLNINVQKYQMTKIAGKELLFVDDLLRIQSDTNLKKALWLALKKMFGL